jgi:DNA-binding MarR family transcriptional regulator
MSAANDALAARELRANVQEFVRKFGLLVTKQTPCGQPVSPSYAHALMVLGEREVRGLITSQTELAETLGLDKSSIARLCARLEADGRVSQRRGAEDGRSRELELTTRGKKMAEVMETASSNRFLRIIVNIPASKRRALLDSLALLTTAVGALEEE